MYNAGPLAEVFRLQANGTTIITGTAATGGRSPGQSFMFSGDADSPLSYLIYDHDNIAMAFDAYYNGTNWVSSDVGSNFALYKINDELVVGYNAGTAKGSTFGGGFDVTGGVRFGVNGGMRVGNATGGSIASSINVAGDLYKNNTAYTNPHGGFEYAYTGKVIRYADRMAAMGLPNYRPLGLEALEAYTRKHFHFPYFADEDANGLFSGGERLLLITEELAVHLFDLNRRLKALEDAEKRRK